MQFKFFTIPVLSVDEESENLNKFLRSAKILEMRKDLVILNNVAYWSFCISYMPHSQDNILSGNVKKVDYKEVLDEIAFQKFSKFRKIRKYLSDKDAVPAYAVFTDAELAELAQFENLDIASLKQVKGIGQKKIDKYGQRLVEKCIHYKTPDIRRIPGVDL